MKRQIQWFLCVMSVLGVSNIALSDNSGNIKKQVDECIGVAVALKEHADGVRDAKEKAHLYGESAESYLEAAELYKEVGEIKKRADALLNAGLVRKNEADNVEATKEKARLYGESAQNYIEAAELYEELGALRECADARGEASVILKNEADNAGSIKEKLRLYSQAGISFGKAVINSGSGEGVVSEARELGYKSFEAGDALLNAAKMTEDVKEKAHLYGESAKNYIEAAREYKRAVWWGEKVDANNRAAALFNACFALYEEADNVEAAKVKADCYGESAKSCIEAAEIYGTLGKTEMRARALRLSCSARTGEMDNSVKAARVKAYWYGESAENCFKAAELYEPLGKTIERVEALYDASLALLGEANNVEGIMEKLSLYGQAGITFGKAVINAIIAGDDKPGEL